MELWKIHKFCETATLSQLLERMSWLATSIKQGELAGTNARMALRLVFQYIELDLM